MTYDCVARHSSRLIIQVTIITLQTRSRDCGLDRSSTIQPIRRHNRCIIIVIVVVKLQRLLLQPIRSNDSRRPRSPLVIDLHIVVVNIIDHHLIVSSNTINVDTPIVLFVYGPNCADLTTITTTTKTTTIVKTTTTASWTTRALVGRTRASRVLAVDDASCRLIHTTISSSSPPATQMSSMVMATRLIGQLAGCAVKVRDCGCLRV